MVRFEVAYHLRSASTPLFAVVLTALSLYMNQQLASGPRHINSPLTVASTTSLCGMFAMLVTAALFVDAATRDVTHRVHAIFYTEPVSKFDYLGGRFLGALAVNVAVSLAIPIGLMLAGVVPSGTGPETSLPFDAMTYLQPFLLFTLPTVFVTATILYTVSVLSRRVLPGYVLAVALSFCMILAIELQVSQGAPNWYAILFDPSGFVALRQHISYWTPAERDVMLIGFPRMLVLNRLVWVSIALGLLALLHVRFRFALSDGASAKRRWFRRPAPLEPAPVGDARLLTLPVVVRSSGLRVAIRQTFLVAGSALREILFSRLFLAIAGGALFVVVITAKQNGAAVFDTTVYPVTHLIATAVLGDIMSIGFVALIAIFAGELVWRDRDAHMGDIMAATPVSVAVTLAGNLLALITMLAVLSGVLMVTGILMQAAQGYYFFEPLLYVKILFGINLADYLLLTVLAIAVHVLLNQKYVGHVIVVGFYVFTLFADVLGIRHNLLVYASDPGWTYSDLNGFGPFVGPLLWFKAYWGAWAFLLAIVAYLMWVRGTEQGFRQRFAQARLRFTGGIVRATAVAVILIASLGGFIFYNTNVLNDYAQSGESAARSAEYERMYKRYEHLPQPTLVASVLRVEIHPGKRSVDIRGSYRLVNTTTQGIDSVHVIPRRAMATRTLSFDRASTLVPVRDGQTYRIYALARPLAPGDSLLMTFELAFAPRGFPNTGINTSVTQNGAYFGRTWLPVIGYQPDFEVSSTETRREYGLAPQTPMASASDSTARYRRSPTLNEDLVYHDVVIGTDETQIAVSPGSLVREWRENGRRYFHYRAEQPLAYASAFLSAQYAVREAQWQPAVDSSHAVSLKVYHHPSHTFNVDRMIESMRASLTYLSGQFGPYQFRDLSVVEFPRYESFARAHPHTIAFSEGSAFLTRVDSMGIDRPFFVTAHETAHQWWGHQASGALVRGAALLSESLAQYSSMMIMEKRFGLEQARRFYDFHMDYYLRGRGNATTPEVPLLEMEGGNYLYYFKGGLALYALREQIGEPRVNAALRRYLDRFRNAPAPYPTSRDLYAELRAETPDSVQSLLSDLFEHVTLWDLKADTVSVSPAENGMHCVTLHLTARKTRTDTLGKETDAPMNDLIEIGVYADTIAAPLYLQQHRIRSGPQTITVMVRGKPHRAGVDPRGRMIQRKRQDDVVLVIKPTSSGI